MNSAGSTIVGIDASNIKAGGGLTHLVELLRAADPMVHGFSRVILWGGMETLSKIEDRPWLAKSHQKILDMGLAYRTFWQVFKLSKLAQEACCDILFVPGSSYVGSFGPVVVISQNLLPFEWSEQRRFGWSWITLKFAILRMIQGRTFVRAEGVIFLTRYARDVVLRILKAPVDKTAIIAHGIDSHFFSSPREQLNSSHYSSQRPYRLLYVSQVNMYKHQWHVAEAVSQLRINNIPIMLDLVGSAYPPALKKLENVLHRVDPAGQFVRYRDEVPHDELHLRYAMADMFVFASSCETFGQILTEAMSAGLPIACSNRSALPEVLGDAGVYFDPEDSNDIAGALFKLIDSPDLRAQLAKAAYERARNFSWQQCANETFGFLARIHFEARGGKL